MRKATDLITIAKVNEQNLTEEQKSTSIKFCEKIGKILENLANHGQYPTTSVILQQHWSRKGYYEQKPTTREYSDERTSYNPVGEMIDSDLNIIIGWFKQYEFKVELHEAYIWQYGCGQSKALELIIRPEII